MIHSERVVALNKRLARAGRYVLYWMQASQRAECNHALEYAVRAGNQRKQPVVVAFGLTERYPEANLRHYTFMLQGLQETERALRERGIQLVVRIGSPDAVALDLSERASLLVADRGYQRVQRRWRANVARRAQCPVLRVESDVVVPVEIASVKEEYAASTLRPKMHRHLRTFLVPLQETRVGRDSLGLRLGGIRPEKLESALSDLRVDRTVAPVGAFTGGTSHAKSLLERFIERDLKHYADLRNDPTLDCVSHMSPYLHFGQVSPLYVALQVARKRGKGRDAYLEELLVRRELAVNLVHYNPDYDSFAGLPQWARATLDEHVGDPREAVYELEDLEQAQTDDSYWNAAQRQMVRTGKMHNYMRMYWAKKILEWSPDPAEALERALYLNNKYQLDGRDPNSYAGVAWCFGKHDRAWGERAVFGKVRYMSAGGLERKFDMGKYMRMAEAEG